MPHVEGPPEQMKAFMNVEVDGPLHMLDMFGLIAPQVQYFHSIDLAQQPARAIPTRRVHFLRPYVPAERQGDCPSQKRLPRYRFQNPPLERSYSCGRATSVH